MKKDWSRSTAPLKHWHVEQSRILKRRSRTARISAKYAPLVLTDSQKIRVELTASRSDLPGLNSHQIAVRLGLTHSAVADFMQKPGA